ncbi:hypothetical protein C6348_16220 [Bacillus sp. YBWC18]|nr:hypothetical protein C6346_15590 [Bacillus sp. CJCL2]PRS82433.1 hypothetical protein C6348_16220 [Bacillus sp. YBWC18]
MKCSNRKVLTGEERQQPVRGIKGKKTKIFALRKTFYEIHPIINRKFSNFPVAISIKQVKRHKSKELIWFLQ